MLFSVVVCVSLYPVPFSFINNFKFCVFDIPCILYIKTERSIKWARVNAFAIINKLGVMSFVV